MNHITKHKHDFKKDLIEARDNGYSIRYPNKLPVGILDSNLILLEYAFHKINLSIPKKSSPPLPSRTPEGHHPISHTLLPNCRFLLPTLQFKSDWMLTLTLLE